MLGGSRAASGAFGARRGLLAPRALPGGAFSRVFPPPRSPPRGRPGGAFAAALEGAGWPGPRFAAGPGARRGTLTPPAARLARRVLPARGSGGGGPAVPRASPLPPPGGGPAVRSRAAETGARPRLACDSWQVILVTGATGFVGSRLLKRLAAASGGEALRATARSVRAADLPAGVEAVPADVTRPETLPAALEGVTTLVHAAAITANLKEPYRGAYRLDQRDRDPANPHDSGRGKPGRLPEWS